MDQQDPIVDKWREIIWSVARARGLNESDRLTVVQDVLFYAHGVGQFLSENRFKRYLVRKARKLAAAYPSEEKIPLFEKNLTIAEREIVALNYAAGIELEQLAFILELEISEAQRLLEGAKDKLRVNLNASE